MSETIERSCCGPACCTEPEVAKTSSAREKEKVVAEVREHYGRIATGAASCCGPQESEATVAAGLGDGADER